MKKLNRLYKIQLFLQKKNLNRLIKLFALVSMVLVLLIAFVQGLQDDQISVKEVWVTNITHNSATIAWISDEKYVGQVVYKPEEGFVWPVLFGQVGGVFANDDRDISALRKSREEGLDKRFTHHVTLVGLEPETSYKFRIAGQINGKEAEVSTFSTLDLDKNPRIPDPAYGKVENVNVNDTFIIVKLHDQENDSMLSMPLAGQGRYSMDMNYFDVDNLKTSDLSAKVVYENKSLADHTYSMQGYKPLEDIVYIPGGQSVDEVGHFLNGDILCKVSADPLEPQGDEQEEGDDNSGTLTGAVPDELQEEELAEKLGLDEAEEGDEGQPESENQKIGISDAEYGMSYDVCGTRAFAERVFNMCGFKYSEKTEALKEKFLDVVLTMGERMDEIIYNFWRNDVSQTVSQGESTIYNTALMKSFNVDDIEEVIAAERIRRKQMRTNRVDIIFNTSNPRGIPVEIALALWFAESAGTFGDTTNSSSLVRDGKDVGEYLGVSCGTHITEQDWTPILDWDEVDGPGRWEKEFERDIACLYGSSSGYNNLAEYPPDPREIGRFIERYGPSRDNFRDLDDPINCGFANKVVRFLTCSIGVERYEENADGGECTIFPIPNDKYNQTELFYDWDGNTTNNTVCFKDEPIQDYLDLTNKEYKETSLDSGDEDPVDQTESNNSDDITENENVDKITETGTYEVIDPDGNKVGEEDLDAGQEPDLYQDFNQNDQQDSNENDVDSSGYSFRKVADTTEYTLVKGWNLIHIPLESLETQDEKTSTASELLGEWNKQGAQIKHVAKFANGRFVLYSEREGGVDYVEDFSISPGQGLAVFNLANESKVIYRGRRLESEDDGSLRDKYLKETFGNVEDDLLLVGFPENYEFGQLDSVDLIDNLKDQQVEITLFSRFIANEGKYQNFVKNEDGEFGEPFEVSGNQGYFVYVKEGPRVEGSGEIIEPERPEEDSDDNDDQKNDQSDEGSEDGFSDDLGGNDDSGEPGYEEPDSEEPDLGQSESEDSSNTDQQIDDALSVGVVVYLGDTSRDVANDIVDFAGQLKGELEEASRFRGFRDPAASPRMKINISKEIIIDDILPQGVRKEDTDHVWVDYDQLIIENNLCGFVNNGEIDEYWIFANEADGVDLYESVMVGPDAFWVNGSPIQNTSCRKNIVLMGFTHNNRLDNALHSFGHRAESILTHFYPDQARKYMGDFEIYKSPMGQFNEIDNALRGSCGNVHFPPNATRHYNYCNTNSIENEVDCSGDKKSREFGGLESRSGVYSDCEGWSLSGPQSKSLVNCTNWGCSQEGYMKWWFQNMPDEFWEKLINLD